MRTKNLFHRDYETFGILGIEGDEDLGGGGDLGGNEPAPFSVSQEDWQRTQSELNELRGYKDKFSTLESKHNEFQEWFKPFLENQDKNKNSDAEPNPEDAKYGGDRAKYARDLVRWEARQEYKAQQEQQSASTKEREEHQAEEKSKQEVYTKLTEADTKGRQKFQDYDQVVSSSVVNLGQVKDLAKNLAKMENPESIAYHFGKNPQEAYAFMNQSHTNPDAALRTLIILDHRFSEAAKAPEQPKREYGVTQKPGGKAGAGETMSDRVKSAVWDEIR